MHNIIANLPTLLGIIAACVAAAAAQDPGKKEAKPAMVVRDESPDHRFGVQYTFANAEEQRVPARIDLVALPSKKILTEIDLIADDDGDRYRGTQVVWAADSQRFAYTIKFKRDTDTCVYEQRDGTFEKLELPDLEAYKPKLRPTERVRKEEGNFNEPVRWLKPKTLLLHREYSVVLEDEAGSLRGEYDLVISFDAKGTGKVDKVLKSKVTRS